MSVQAYVNSWKGRAKHIASLLYSTKHVRYPDWREIHRLYIADKKREMPSKQNDIMMPSSHHNVCFSDEHLRISHMGVSLG